MIALFFAFAFRDTHTHTHCTCTTTQVLQLDFEGELLDGVNISVGYIYQLPALCIGVLLRLEALVLIIWNNKIEARWWRGWDGFASTSLLFLGWAPLGSGRDCDNCLVETCLLARMRRRYSHLEQPIRLHHGIDRLKVGSLGNNVITNREISNFAQVCERFLWRFLGHHQLGEGTLSIKTSDCSPS